MASLPRSFPLFTFSLAALLFFSAGKELTAQESPRLVVDPQGHSGFIGEMTFTPDGSELVSAGQDKTIRVWSVENGELLRTIRTEIADAEDGKHFACAMSPDGRWLAVGGWGMSAGENYGVVTVIDFVNDRVAAVLKGHKDVVHSLDFSPEGSLLVSASSDNTARVWKTSAWSDNPGGGAVEIDTAEVLKSHVNKAYAAAFAGSPNQLLTGSFDHGLRFWKNSGSGFKEIALFGDHKAAIVELEVSSDGKWAVSGDLEGKLFLWNVEMRSLAAKLDTEMELTLGGIAFSPDGRRVLASSKAATGGKTAIYSIPSGTVEQEFSFHDNSVTSAVWHPTKSLVALSGSNDHSIIAFHPDTGDVVHTMVGAGSAVWNVGMPLDGKLEMALGFIPPEPQPTISSIFDFQGFVFRQIETAEEAMRFYSAFGNVGDQVLNFESISSLQVGTQGKITNDYDGNDRFNVASYTSTGDSVIVGSSYFLRRYQKKNGKFEVVTEYRGHESEIRMVVPSADDKVLASGSLDQTARLWNLETGELLATLFVARDGEWVAWTPEGYYAASPNGGKYIGWHFNRGIDSLADYISGDQLHEQFYRPDVVRTAIAERRSGADIVKELGLAAVDLNKAVEGAPGVAILEPTGDTKATVRRLAVKVRATDEGGGIGEVRVFHEGKRLQPDGPGSFRDGAYEVPFTVSLLSGRNEIRAVAVNPDGVESTPDIAHVEFAGSEATAKLYLLAVGVNEYKNPRFALNYCRPDADAFADAVQKRAKSLFSTIEVSKLYDAEATADGIREKLEEVAAVSTPEDVFVFVFAGHGVMSEGTGSRDSEFHIIPHDVTQMYGDDDQLAEKAISGSRLQELASRIPARKQLMVLDACQSGGVVESFAVRGAAEERALAQLARSSGMYVLASTRSEQFATEAKELGHGLFTYALLEGLDGKGDGNEDGKITVKEIEAYLNERVPELSEEHTGAAQYPNSFARGQDFPIGLSQ